MSYEYLKQYIEETPDHPEKGVLFRDISPALRDKFNEVVDSMLALITPEEMQKIDAFVGLDARGFIFAAAMAARTGKGMVMARKGGKLPQPKEAENYMLEYGTATIEMKHGKGGNVFIVDDVLATGGTLRAAGNLSLKAGYNVVGFGVFVNISALNNFEWRGMKCRAALTY